MPLIIVDTREQEPFPLEGLRVIRRKLDFGDYSLMGHQKRVAVERKSFEDLFGTLASLKSIERFERELLRAGEAGARLYIVIEADPAQVYAGFRMTQVPGRAILERLFKLCSRHGVAPGSCNGHRRADHVYFVAGSSRPGRSPVMAAPA